jgi:predicted exporter
MTAARAWALGVWLICIALAAIVVARARYIADLSAFLPAHPTPTQQFLVDQLRDGPATRLILIAIEGGDAAARAQASRAMAQRLRQDVQFVSINNGETAAGQVDREFLFKHRYLLSESVNAARFSPSGLRDAISETIDNLSSPAGLLFKSLLPRDPTGELLNIVDQLQRAQGPATRDGVWISPDGSRALAVAQTSAGGSDSDAQSRAIDAINTAFSAAAKDQSLRVRLTGPGVFAVQARAKIQRAAVRLSIISGILVVALLLLVYRSVAALGLGLLPVASGAVVGIAAVALGFGAVHGITLGFGITLIGESVDYSIYFFIQSQRRAGDPTLEEWRRQWWPTIRLGMLTSVCGFASLLPSGFPGLKQLGLYSISGLVSAALVTRYLLPALLPASFAIRDVAPLGHRLAQLLAPLQRFGVGRMSLCATALALLCVLCLAQAHSRLWNHELAALSPISVEEQNYDAHLRADLGAADVRDIVIVSGADLEAVLGGAEAAAAPLQKLVDAKVIGSFDSPSNYLPSTITQEARRGSLPAPAELRANLKQATEGLPIRSERLQPFLEDAEATRHGALITARDMSGTSLGAGFEALILHSQDRWNALLPLHGVAAGRDIDLSRVAGVLQEANLAQTRVLDLKQESDSLYASYLGEALHYSLAGFAALTVLLLIALRSPRRVLLVLLPLILAVLSVAAALVLAGVQLTILHLVGMLLIVAIGSNYALFFDRQAHTAEAEGQSLTLASLVIANASTVIGFGLLSFSQVPVLVALGATVAPGALLALIFSAVFSATLSGPSRSTNA